MFYLLCRHETPMHLHRGYAIISKEGEVYSSQMPYQQQKIPVYVIFGDVQICTNVRKELLQMPLYCNTISR